MQLVYSIQHSITMEMSAFPTHDGLIQQVVAKMANRVVLYILFELDR